LKVSIIIPVYNEAHNLREVLDLVLKAPLPEGFTKEVIVVDDGSSDGTNLVVEEYAANGRVTGCYSIENGGKGTAIRKGLALASGDVVLIQDGDLEYDPDDYMRLVSPIANNEAEVVYGSRFLGKILGMSVKSLLANKALTLIANLLYGAKITDEATAYKVFRASVLKQLLLECKRFEFCPEVTAKVRRIGYRIHEVPVSYRARRFAEGKKIRAQDGFWAVWTLLKCRLVSRRKLACSLVAIRENEVRTLTGKLAGTRPFRVG
jgi:dolichol-phosphate mannosyltransferase